MKTLFWLLLACALVAGLYLYFNPHKTEELRSLSTELAAPLSKSSPKSTQLYRWQNARGEWQFTDFPPPKGTPYEMREYRSDENVLPLPPQLQNP